MAEDATDLHVWTAETADCGDWVVAQSAEDACALYCEQIGIDPATSDEEDAQIGARPSNWTVCPDEEVLLRIEECPERHVEGVECPRGCRVSGDSVAFASSEHHGRVIVHSRQTCAWYVAKYGRAYLCAGVWGYGGFGRGRQCVGRPKTEGALKGDVAADARGSGLSR